MCSSRPPAAPTRARAWSGMIFMIMNSVALSQDSMWLGRRNRNAENSATDSATVRHSRPQRPGPGASGRSPGRLRAAAPESRNSRLEAISTTGPSRNSANSTMKPKKRSAMAVSSSTPAIRTRRRWPGAAPTCPGSTGT